jgi:hypothetical protein
MLPACYGDNFTLLIVLYSRQEPRSLRKLYIVTEHVGIRLEKTGSVSVLKVAREKRFYKGLERNFLSTENSVKMEYIALHYSPQHNRIAGYLEVVAIPPSSLLFFPPARL